MPDLIVLSEADVEVDKTQVGWNADDVDAAAEDFSLLIDWGY